jgi:glycerol kinase
MLDALDIPRAMLPEVRKSSEVYGQTNIGARNGSGDRSGRLLPASRA